MAGLVLKSPYLKPGAKSHLANYALYIATRDGVEMTDDTSGFLDATHIQKKEIESLLRKYPDSAQLHEYADYCLHANRANADEFIMRVAELHPELFESRKGYVSYIANRPGAEKTAGNGLFTDDGVPVVLENVMREVSGHQGNVWTHIISLSREDAQRLGYDSAAEWKELLRSQRNVFAQHMKIRPENFRWYAAFHNEGHHPHVHMIAYSVDPKEAYLTPQGITKIKSSLAREIFRQDLISVYEKQTEYRDRLRRSSRELVADIVSQIRNGGCEDSKIANRLIALSKRLANTGGKKVYGYLKADVKAIVNSVVDMLAQDERIAKLYDLWYEQKFEVLRTYTDTMPPKIPLSENKEFKSIKNAVIQEAMKLIPLLNETQSPEQITGASMTGAINLLYHLSRIFEDRIHSTDMPMQATKENRAEEEKRAAHGLKHG